MNQVKKTRSKSILLAIMAVFLMLCLSVIASLVVVSQSDSANRWLLQTLSESVPELTFSDIQGNLAQGIALNVLYETDDIALTLEGMNVHIDHPCFWQLALCIPKLTINNLNIQINSTPSTDTPSAITLPTLRSPIYVDLQQASIKQFSLQYDNTQILNETNVSLKADWINTRLRIKELQSTNEYCQWNTKTTLRFRHQYPLEGVLICPTLETLAHDIKVQFKGDLAQLNLSGGLNVQLQELIPEANQAEVPLSFSAQLDTLTPDLPLQATANLDKPLQLNQSPQATIGQARVKAQGSLSQLAIESHVTAQLEPIEHNAVFSLKATTDLNNLIITELLTQVQGSSITTTGTLNISPNLTFDGASTINHVDLALVNTPIEGFLQGKVKHNLSIINDEPEASVHIQQLSGDFSGYPWQAKGSVLWKQALLHLQQIHITQVDNTLKANGSWSQKGKADISVSFDIDAIEKLYPDAAGKVEGKLNIGGNPLLPDITGTLVGNDLAFGDIAIESVNSQIQWITDKRAQNTVDVKIKNMKAGEDTLLNGDFALAGTLKNHAIRMNANDALKNTIQLNCDGAFTAFESDKPLQAWQATCNNLKATLSHPTEQQAAPWITLKLDNQAQLAYEANKDFTLLPFCLRSGESKLCLTSTLIANAQGINDTYISATALPAQWLRPWLPDYITISGTSNAHGAIKQKAQVLDFNIDSGNTAFTYQQDDTTQLKLDFDLIEAHVLKTPGNIQIQWQLDSKQAGNSEARITIESDTLNGNLKLNNVRLGPISKLFLPEENDIVQGKVEADINLSGLLTKPKLDGNLRLTEGSIQHSALPERIEQLNVELIASPDYEANFTGRFLVQNNPGTMSGTFNWQQDWWSEFNIKANNLVYQPQDNIIVYVSPDLSTRVSATEINITGDVHIPEARVYLQALPEQAVGLSRDAEIVGTDQPQTTSQEITSQITLVLGERVRFKGFGLDTHLEGRIGIKQRPGTPLASNGIIRLEKGSYQAYGQTLSISEGDLVFIDDIDNPLLRLSAVRDRVSDNVVVGVKVNGRARNPDVEFFSIPEMTQQEQIHYLVTGRAPNTEASSESSVAAEAAISMALEARTGKLTRKAGDMLGIDDLTLSTGSTEDRSEVGISGYITPDLMIRYGVGMFEAVNTITLNYRIRNNLYFEVISGKSNAVDLLWSFDRD